MKSTVKFYLTLLLRRAPFMALIVLVTTGVGVGLAIQLPTVYSTEAKLLVESAAIPDQLAASTVQTQANEQMQVFEQRLMTRANLMDIARKYEAFDNLDQMTPDEIVSRMRESTRIRTTAGRDRANLMTIAFDANIPRVAADVVNEYVTIILDENIRYRTNLAEDTGEFFEQEVERLSADLDIQKERILRFKQTNADALPENLAFRMGRQELLQDRIAEGERRTVELNEQRDRLVRIFEAGGAAFIQEEDLPPEQRQLRELNQQLATALTVYSEENPRVKVLRTRIEQLERVVAQQSGGGTSDNEPVSVLQVQLDQIDAQIEFLARQVDEAEVELDEVSDSISRTPANAIALEALERDYRNIQDLYNRSIERLARAETGERIELLSKGQRISVVEPPTVPTDPTSPNRPRIAQASVLAGFAIAGGFFILLELFNTAIRRPKELTTALGIAPFAVLPYMSTERDKRRRMFLWIAVVGLLIAIVSAALWAAHTYYLPMDLLIEKVVQRLGIDSLLPF